MIYMHAHVVPLLDPRGVIVCMNCENSDAYISLFSGSNKTREGFYREGPDQVASDTLRSERGTEPRRPNGRLGQRWDITVL